MEAAVAESEKLAADEKAIDDAMKMVEMATTQADRDQATASITALRETHAERVERLKVLEEQARRAAKVD